MFENYFRNTHTQNTIRFTSSNGQKKKNTLGIKKLVAGERPAYYLFIFIKLFIYFL